jgi:hypothetical protein
LDAKPVLELTQEQMDIWKTPEGVLFMNGELVNRSPITPKVTLCVVLPRKESNVNQKGKEAEIQKWEAEVRQSLINKKAGGPKLTKQEEAMLQAQLAKEKAIRSEIDAMRLRLCEGLDVVRSLVDTRLEAFQRYISPITSLFLACALDKPAQLVGDALFDAFIVSRYRRGCRDKLINLDRN